MPPLKWGFHFLEWWRWVQLLWFDEHTCERQWTLVVVVGVGSAAVGSHGRLCVPKVAVVVVLVVVAEGLF